jgi:MOSC domain-containing protein YiiM
MGLTDGVDVHRYDVEVVHLLVSPGHNYFGRPKDGPGDHPTYDLDEVQLVAGKGVVGDRFFGQAAHLDAAVTLFAVEALEAVADELRLGAVPDPLLTRRNVVLRGADVNALRGHEFALESADGGARAVLFGGRPAAPCAWMDRMLAPGVHAALRGRGGLRCRVQEDGILRRGPAVLMSPVPLDPAAAGRPAIRTTALP